MSWDTDHITQLLDEIIATKGEASKRKSEELLRYVESFKDPVAPTDRRQGTSGDNEKSPGELQPSDH